MRDYLLKDNAVIDLSEKILPWCRDKGTFTSSAAKKEFRQNPPSTILKALSMLVDNGQLKKVDYYTYRAVVY